MTNPKGGQSVSTWLLVALGVLVVVAVVALLANHSQSSDPTLTAAPKIVSTPDHPIVIHTKSPEVYEEQMREAGVPQKAWKPGPPPTGN